MQTNSSVKSPGAPGPAASVNIEALTAARISSAPLADVLRWLDTTAEGLSGAEASARLLRYGPNSVRTHRVNAIAVLGRQLRSAVLGLLAATAVVSFFLGDSKQAIIIGVILAASIVPNAPPPRCIRGYTTPPWCTAMAGSSRSMSTAWCPAM